MKAMRFLKYSPAIMAFGIFMLTGCQASENAQPDSAAVVTITSGNYQYQIDSHLRTKLSGAKNLTEDFVVSEYVQTTDGIIADFSLLSHSSAQVNDKFGAGKQYVITGKSSENMQKQLTVIAYDDYPGIFVVSVVYTNQSASVAKLRKWVNHAYSISADNPGDSQSFWSYQGASFADRRDWVVPVTPGFYQQNYMGMNSSDYGSGTPVSDVWTPSAGIAVGHLETTPKLVSLPVSMPAIDAKSYVQIEYDYPTVLNPGDSISSFVTFVSPHEGDFFSTLVAYRKLLSAQGMAPPEFPDASYEPVWCAWGYERDFVTTDIIETLPKAAEMGFEWAVLDDGWQTAEGDWYLNKERFPEGDKSMTAFVDDIHNAGMKAKLWWAPLAADPGTELLEKHADMLLLDKEGKPVDITWWDSYYLCPAYAKTIAHSKALVEKMMSEWGYEGLKIDGQHLNGVPPCYNPAHHHERPEESVEALQEYWKVVYDTALSIDKSAVVEICPCGTSYSYFNIPYMNQAVSSDPLSSWQIRLKGKVLKALMGESAPYYGDHVELSDNADDFASSVGIGAVVGTKFTWPPTKVPEKGFALTPEKEQRFQHWVNIYKDKMLPKGVYRGELYDLGFDKPETHAIQKGRAMYYAFYATQYNGDVELRGLPADGKYNVRDYEHDTDLGTVSARESKITISFSNHLLIEVTPIE